MSIFAFGLYNSTLEVFIAVLLDVTVYFIFLVLLLNFTKIPSTLALVTMSFVTPTIIFLIGLAYSFTPWVNCLHWSGVCLMMGCFTQTYPSFEGQLSNPTIMMLTEIKRNPNISVEELVIFMNTQKSESGHDKLQRDKFVDFDEKNQPRLTILGSALACFFLKYKNMMRDSETSG